MESNRGTVGRGGREWFRRPRSTSERDDPPPIRSSKLKRGASYGAPLVVFLAIAVSAVALGQDDPVGGVTVERGVVYRGARALGGGRARLRLDVYRPKAVTKAPAMIWVHGGGFTGGRREHMASYAQAMAERGYVSATISYRLGNAELRRRLGFRALVDAAEHDLEGAVAWFRRHRRGLDVNTRRLFVGGYSAGAVTSLRVALRGTGQVRGAVIVAGAVSGPATRRAAPVLWFHGRNDMTVPYSAARRGCALARRRGHGCRLVTFGGGHEIVGTRAPAILKRTAAWLRRR